MAAQLPHSTSGWAPLLPPIALLMTGCLLNNIELESIISKKVPYSDPSAGGLLTLLQFAFIAAVSSPYALSWRGPLAPSNPSLSASSSTSFPRLLSRLQFPVERRASVVPLREYVTMAALFSLMSFLNNAAFAFHITQPMHMVFRSSNLMVSYAYAALVRRTMKHDPVKLGAVLLLTAGAVVATLAEARVGDASSSSSSSIPCSTCDGSGATTDTAAALAAAGSAAAAAAAAAAASSAAGRHLFFLQWCGGVAILATVLVLQTLLGAKQDETSKAYGRAPFESMFYLHTLSLPALAVLSAKTAPASLARWAASPRADTVFAELAVAAKASGTAGGLLTAFSARSLLWLSGRLGSVWGALSFANAPVLWVHVALNVVTQWLCLVGVYSLISQADQLTVNVVLTVRKFASLMASIALFGNAFYGFHWLGACLVFGGAALYGAAPQAAAQLERWGILKGEAGGAAAAAAAAAAAVKVASAVAAGTAGGSSSKRRGSASAASAQPLDQGKGNDAAVSAAVSAAAASAVASSATSASERGRGGAIRSASRGRLRAAADGAAAAAEGTLAGGGRGRSPSAAKRGARPK